MLTFLRITFAPPRDLLLLLAAAWIGLLLAERRSARRGISTDDLNNLVFYSLLAFVVGGRLTYVVQNFGSFHANPLDVFSISADLFDAVGGIAAAAIALLLYSQRRELSFLSALDALTPLLAVLGIGLGLRHLAAGTAFELPTNLPWGIELWNAKRHPTQIYDMIAASLTFCLLWFKRPNPRPGIDFLILASCTAASQILVGGLRADSDLVLNGLHQVQVNALPVLIACLALLEVLLQRKEAQPPARVKKKRSA